MKENDESKSVAKKGNNAGKIDAMGVRKNIQNELVRLGPKFWQYLEDLPPKAFMEYYIKMLPYGFSKVPDERPIGEDERQRLILEETTRKATLIGGGLPQPEDSFEEEDE